MWFEVFTGLKATGHRQEVYRNVGLIPDGTVYRVESDEGGGQAHCRRRGDREEYVDTGSIAFLQAVQSFEEGGMLD